MSKKMFLIILAMLLLFNHGFLVGAVSKPGESAKCLFPESSPPADNVDVVDLIEESSDMKLAMITLQGHINSDRQSKVCFKIWNQASQNTPVTFWLDYFKTKKYIKSYQELPIKDFLKKYNHCYEKVIIYDPNLPATINIATMIGSLEKGIVVSPADASRFSKEKQITDLRNRWSKNISAYEWALENLWPKMNHNILSCQHPTFADHHLRDYLIRHKVFQFWVTGKNAQDGKASDYKTELAFAKKLFSMSPANIPLIGWLGTDHTDDGLTEYHGVGLAGEYGKITVGSNWGTNLSLISGIEVDIPAMVQRYQKRLDNPMPRLQSDKVYLCFAVQESGDAPIYWECVQKKVWADPARGKMPIGWSLGVPVFELCPAILEWFYDNASAKDHFYIAMSGTGYCHPYRGLFSKTKNPRAEWEKYLSITDHYLKLSRIGQMGLYTDAWLPFDRSKQDPVTLKFAEGLSAVDTLIVGMGRDENVLEMGHNYLLGKRNVLVSHVVTRWDAHNIGRNAKNNQWLAEEIRKNTPQQRPAFLFVHPLSWSYFPSDLVDVMDRLGDDYIAISPEHFRPMYLQAGSKK